MPANTSTPQITSKIINRCLNEELSTGAGPGGPIASLTRDLPTSDIQSIIAELDYQSRAEPRQNIRWRYNQVVDFLKRELDHHSSLERKTRIQTLAHSAKLRGQETCECGAEHPSGAKYYVTAIDGKKTLPLSGPYPTHAEAVAMVDEVRELAIRLDPGAAFASFGTVAMPRTYWKRGILDQYK